MLMNKFTAFEDAAMLNMHGLSNTVHGTEWGQGGGVGGGGCERGEGEDKDGRVEGEVEGRKKGKMKRRLGYPSLSSITTLSPLLDL